MRKSKGDQEEQNWLRVCRHYRTNYIDIYLLHRDDSKTPVGELIEYIK